MNFRIVVDSCCDLTHVELSDPCFSKVALSIHVGNDQFIDDDSLDTHTLLQAMHRCPTAPSTACPSPQQYLDAFACGAEEIYVVCLSALLSGSHNSAELARSLYLEEHPNVHIKVFNSCSASAGEALLALKLRELASSGLSFDDVVAQADAYIGEMNTLFVLESLENLRKSGRLNALQSLITGTLRLKLLMGSTPSGEICKRGQAMSIKQALSKMVDLMAGDPRHTGRTLFIAHCQCLERAYALQELVRKRCDFGEIIIGATGGISTVYANLGGIIVAY